MHAKIVGAAFVAALSLAASAGSSRAEPPPPMWVGALEVPVVVCDTREQAVAIVKAGQVSSEAMLAKYQELSTTMNDKGEPACVSSPISLLAVNEREDLRLSRAASGDLVHVWIVHGGTRKADFWFIYAESDPQNIA